jgi:hypothetical protein
MGLDAPRGALHAPTPHAARHFLGELCDEIDRAERRAERLRAIGRAADPLSHGESWIRLSVHKDWACHARPHLHASHSERFDVSIGIDDCEVIAGRIDSTSRAALLAVLAGRGPELHEVWTLLAAAPSSIDVDRLIAAR